MRLKNFRIFLHSIETLSFLAVYLFVYYYIFVFILIFLFCFASLHIGCVRFGLVWFDECVALLAFNSIQFEMTRTHNAIQSNPIQCIALHVCVRIHRHVNTNKYNAVTCFNAIVLNLRSSRQVCCLFFIHFKI